MPEKIGFEFPTDNSDQWDGFNDAGIEHFSGMPYAGLGREVPQNVVDAMQVPPAKIDVRLIEVPTESIPGIRELRKVLGRCLKNAAEESEKAKIFFERAVELVRQRKIKVRWTPSVGQESGLDKVDSSAG